MRLEEKSETPFVSPKEMVINQYCTVGGIAVPLHRTFSDGKVTNHPARSVTANGRHAAYLTEHHDLSNVFGDGSPIGRIYELDGFVLLIGVGYNKNTSFHLADARADYPSKHLSTEHSAVMENGQRVWKVYNTLYVDGEDFIQIGEAFEKEHTVSKVQLGNATLRLMRQRDLVDFAVRWIEKYRK